MNKKLSIQNIWRSNIFIILIFAIISILSGMFTYHAHFVGMEPDLEFHWQRIYEIRSSIVSGNGLPNIALNKFSQSGTAVMSMYPNINLWPTVLLSFFIKSSINLFNSIFIIRTFFDLLIAYFACFKFNKSKKIGILFATSYVLCTLNLYNYFSVSGVGTLSVISYLPLVLFGFLSLLKENKWIELSIGMTMVIYSHILGTGIVLLFLISCFIYNIKEFRDYKRIKSLVTSIIVTILSTSIFWIYFCVLNMNNKMNIPTSSVLYGKKTTDVFFGALDNYPGSTINLSALVGLLFGIFCFKKLSRYNKGLFWISIIFMLVASDIFPWSIAEHTFLIHLQSPERLYIIPQILLCYLFSECLVKISANYYHNILILSSSILLIIILQLGAQETFVNSYSTRPELNTPYNYNMNFMLKNNQEFNNILNSQSSSSDYYPQVSMSKHSNISNHLSTYDNNKHLYAKPLGNGKFSFKAPQKINELSLPFLYYNGVDYQVKLDDKTVKGYPNKNAFMTINNVRKGKHHVQIIVHKTKSEIVSYILSLIGLLILLGAIFKGFLMKLKNK